MKTRIPFVLILLQAVVMARAGVPPVTVAVYNFAGDAEAASYGDKVTALVTADLTDETNLVMLERAELNKALQEQAFGSSGMVSSDAAAKIGQITGAKVLVAGEVMKIGDNHLVVVANIIGTETGRLFADKVEGPADALAQLTSDLSRKIALTITSQTANLVISTPESREDRLDRIVKSVKGKNRPTVSINIKLLRINANGRSTAAEEEFGRILLKTGFPVVDENSDQKPDVEITGVASYDTGPAHNGMFSARGVLELKVQERLTGRIIAFERLENTAPDSSQKVAVQAAQTSAVDELAERILPLLAK
jgi:TolB-like protein